MSINSSPPEGLTLASGGSMGNPEYMTIEEGADAMRRLVEELDATHAAPFTACFLDEHWESIERALDHLVNGSDSCSWAEQPQRPPF